MEKLLLQQIQIVLLLAFLAFAGSVAARAVVAEDGEAAFMRKGNEITAATRLALVVFGAQNAVTHVCLAPHLAAAVGEVSIEAV